MEVQKGPCELHGAADDPAKRMLAPTMACGLSLASRPSGSITQDSKSLFAVEEVRCCMLDMTSASVVSPSTASCYTATVQDAT